MLRKDGEEVVVWGRRVRISDKLVVIEIKAVERIFFRKCLETFAEHKE